jgi:branched-chain amino acid transport system substrate-binding protein
MGGGIGLAVHQNGKFYVDNVRITGPSRAPVAEGWELYDDFDGGSLDEGRWEWQPATDGDTVTVDPEGRLLIEASNPGQEELYGQLLALTGGPIMGVQADLLVKEIRGEFTDLYLALAADGGRMAGIMGQDGAISAYEHEGGLRFLLEGRGIPAELRLQLTLTAKGTMDVRVNGEWVGEIPAGPVADGFFITYRLDPGGALVGLVDNVRVMFTDKAATPHEPPDEIGFECPDDLGCVGIPPGEPVLIAHLLDQSGPTQTLSQDILRGIELAVEERREILGHPIELAGFDSGCALLAGRQAAEQIVQNPDVVAVVGTTCSLSAGAAAPIITKAGLVMVSPSNTRPLLTDPQMHQAGYLRVAPNDKTQGAAAAEFARSDALAAGTVAILYEENGYSEFLALTFGRAFKDLGGEILLQEPITMEDQEDLRRLLEMTAEARPDLIFYPLFVEAGARLTTMIRETPGLAETALMGADGMLDPTLLEISGPAAEGLYLVSPDYVARGDRYERFLIRFQELFGGQPQGVYHAHGYDATALILQAIEQVAVPQGDVLVVPRGGLREALFATRGFEGLTGVLNCSPTGDCAEPKASVYQIVSGDPESWNPPDENPRRVWP